MNTERVMSSTSTASQRRDRVVGPEAPPSTPDPRPSPLEFARAAYRDISLYAPNREPCAIDLSDNTNAWGAAPGALRVAREAPAEALTRYPSLYAPTLKQALARYVGVDAAQVVTGCGSDDVLDSAIRAFCEPGDRIAYPDPSFPMVPIFGQMNGLEPVAVPLRADWSVDADAMLATGARVLYVCSPNNPTGTLASRDAILHILARAPGVVIVDEAYAEFGGADWAREAPAHDRLLVVRTMSKAFGLAGLRVGYATGAAPLVAEVEKSRGPYKVNALAERAAVAALTEDGAWVRAHVDEAVAVRARLTEALAAMGLAPVPSHANFVLVAVPDAQRVSLRMRERGVAVRPFTALRGVGDALRISVGPWPMVERALDALRAVLGEGA